ncbi:glycosyltransferase family 2 protein [Fictibacillus barbaricus]|uniref:Teichuronic acid biosynthesis glycosyltransferase TuaG n=1 Tax=Fictibacillus barbaricus TaxID=182136 RepID=A0ABU1U142_9BACL|nr:glycosyltransferase family 2 protein [Fictibacillus barbaricus]MDR7073187.1 teichuronic acid biosynthesis glycosyltransferase TuaG [Fictibacillus barbaricus]
MQQNKTTSTPLISIITPTFNGLKFIEYTANSIISQSYSKWEWLIVDDFSTDGTQQYLKELAQKDDRIKVTLLNENSGTAIARNTAIQEARGKYIAFLDSDDVWHPEKLNKQIRFMQENDYAFSFSQYRIMNEDGTHTEKLIKVPEKIDYNGLLKNTIIGCLTVMIDVEKIGKVSMPNIRTRQDFVLWLSILKKGFVAYGMQEELAYYRKVNGSISSNKLKAAKMNWKVYRNIEKLSITRAAWSFMNYAWNAYKKN